jgi:hypothetical protein
MATKEDIAIAIAVVKEISGNPDSGAIKELIDLLDSSTAPKEVRIIGAAEKR